MGRATKRGKRLVPDVLDQLEGSRGKAAICVQHKGNKRAALLLRVDTILAYLVPLSLSRGFSRGHVHIGGGVRVHTRDVKVHRAVEHVNLAVGEKVGQVFLHHVSSAVVAAGEAAKQLAAAVMPPRDRLALKLGAAQSVPWRGRDIFFAECTRAWHVVQRRKPKAKAGHNGGAKVGVYGGGGGGLHPSLGGLMPARGETDHVRVGALRALEEGVEAVVEDLLRERALQALQLGDALVVRDDLVRVQRQRAQTRREVGVLGLVGPVPGAAHRSGPACRRQ